MFVTILSPVIDDDPDYENEIDKDFDEDIDRIFFKWPICITFRNFLIYSFLGYSHILNKKNDIF